MAAQALSTRVWIQIFKILALVNALAICGDSLFFLTKGFIHHLSFSELRAHEPWGILLNASMSGCLNAAIFPLFNSKEKTSRYFVLISVLATGRSLPIAVLFTGVGATLFIQRKYLALSLAVPLSIALGILIKGQNLFESRGREFIWTQAYYFFREQLNLVIGSGLGGFLVYGPMMTHKSQGIVFIWLHSDWLQTFFEQGLLGFTVIVGMYFHALLRAKKIPQLFSTLTAYAAFGVANMPLRYPLAGLFGAVLIRWAMEKQGVHLTHPPLKEIPSLDLRASLAKALRRVRKLW
jgi:hypothetical protein